MAADDGLVTSRDAVIAALEEFDRRFAAGNPAELAELFAEDGRMIQPHREEIVGRVAIEAHTRRTFDDYDPAAWRTERRLVDVHGDRAYALLTYTETLVHRAEGPSLDIAGRLVLFLVRTDGSWQVSLALNNHVRPVREVSPPA